jgi:hypothetical protein
VPEKEEIPSNNAEIAQHRFRSAITDRFKADEPAKEPSEKPEVPQVPQVQTAASTVVQQPLPASSAPPPSIGEDSVHVQPTVKAASAEPTIKIDAPPPQVHENNVNVERAASPLPPTDTKDQAQVQEEEDAEKLLEMERQFTDMYEKNSEHIEKLEYSFEVMDMIREIVKVSVDK